VPGATAARSARFGSDAPHIRGEADYSALVDDEREFLDRAASTPR